MATRLRPVEITNYALNELDPRERLYVESMMLGCKDSRRDVLEMIEMARLLEEGMRADAAAMPLALDVNRRREILSAAPQDGAWQNVCRGAAAAVAMAACVAFSIAAPQIWSSALRPIAQQQQQQQMDASRSLAELDSWAALLQAASSASPGAFDEPEVVVPEEFPTRILVPKGTVGMVDMPVPSLGGSESN
jgi:anti-sigma factor RsiW